MNPHPLLRKRVMAPLHGGKFVVGRLMDVDYNVAAHIKSGRMLYVVDIKEVKPATRADLVWLQLKGAIQHD